MGPGIKGRGGAGCLSKIAKLGHWLIDAYRDTEQFHFGVQNNFCPNLSTVRMILQFEETKFFKIEEVKHYGSRH